MGGIARNFLGLTPASDPQIKKFSRNDLHIICLYGYPPHYSRGLNRFRGQRKIWAGNKLLSSIFAYVCMFFLPWYWFFGLVLSQFYGISSLLFSLILSWPSIFVKFLFIFFLRPFIPLNYIPVPFSIALTRLFPLYNVQIAHPLDMYRTWFPKSLFFHFYILFLLISSNSFFILFLLSTETFLVCLPSSISTPS